MGNGHVCDMRGAIECISGDHRLFQGQIVSLLDHINVLVLQISLMHS